MATAAQRIIRLLRDVPTHDQLDAIRKQISIRRRALEQQERDRSLAPYWERAKTWKPGETLWGTVK